MADAINVLPATPDTSVHEHSAEALQYAINMQHKGGMAPPAAPLPNLPALKASLNATLAPIHNHSSADNTLIIGSVGTSAADSLPDLPSTLPSCLPSSLRHHPYSEIAASLPNFCFPGPSDTSVGAIRARRRGKHALKRTSASLSTRTVSDSGDEYRYEEIFANLDDVGEIAGESPVGRTIKVGDHSFTIPLKSPVVKPQLQANVRLTSTGRPSHARKVPDDHVKRPRNAFILFRSYACTSNLLPPSMGINDHRQVSRIVGSLWKNLKPEEKAIWEKKAAQEKEAHKLANPNYRYRPVYRKENGNRRRRIRESDVKEAEEEERKCEVVARVLLEGREVTGEELDQEVEAQKAVDQAEGRQRGQRTRSRSRSRSTNSNDGGKHDRKSSDSPDADEVINKLSFDGMHLQPTMPLHFARNGRHRSSTMPASHSEFGLPGMPYPYYNAGMPQLNPAAAVLGALTTRSSHSGYIGGVNSAPVHPSPRAANCMPHIASEFSFGSGDGLPYSHSGLKSNADDDVSLLSPSFPRKFSLGRWEVPGGPMNAFSESAVGQTLAFPVDADYSGIEREASISYRDGYEGGQDGQSQPYMSQGDQSYVPTYVYLSKADAQNPQIVEHYLSQGMGVSFSVD